MLLAEPAIDPFGPDRVAADGLAGAAWRVLQLLARHRWVFLITVVVVVGWVQQDAYPTDLGIFADAGRLILTGHWGQVYADDSIQAGPLELLSAVLVLPFREPRGPELLLLHVLGGAGVVALALGGTRWLRRIFGLAESPVVELLTGFVVAAWIIPGMLFAGHLAELAIPLMWVCGAILLPRGRSIEGAMVLGLACGWETWGILAAPLLLLAPRGRSFVLASVAWAATVAAFYVPFVLSGHFAMFDLAWPISDGTPVHALWPHLTDFTWGMRLAQGALALLACGAVVRMVPEARRVVWLAPLTALSVRLLLDPTMYTYYWVAPCILAVVGLALVDQARVGELAAVVALLYLPFLAYGPTKPYTLVASLVAVGVLCSYARRSVPAET